MLLPMVISLNQLSFYGALADLCNELNKNSSEDSAEDSSEDSESSGTLYTKEILETRRFVQVSKFITRLPTQSKVYREEDGGVHYDQVIDECKKKHLNNTECWSVEMKKDFVKAPNWSWQKVEDKRKGFNTA